MKKTLQRHLGLAAALTAAVFAFSAATVSAYEVGTNFTLCTASVSQDACYSGGYPTPTVNWTFSGAGSQASYQVQFDQNQNFNNIEMDTGEVASGAASYQVAQAGLNFNQAYYWRVRARDSFGSLGDWAAADSSFTTNDICPDPPTATGLSVSDGGSETYCSSAAHYFSWTYTDPGDKKEDEFEFQVDNNSDFSSPEVDRDYTGLNNDSPTVNSQTVTVAESPAADQLGYGATYYWRVNLYNKQGASSGWISGPSFTTESHRYPAIDFNWSLFTPSKGEDVLFADQSTVYGGASKSIWSWIFQNGNPAGSSQQNPIIKFTSNGQKTVTLEVTDSDGYACSGDKTVTVGFSLPDWREILPF